MRIDYVSNFKNFIATLNHVSQEQLEIFQKTVENQLGNLQLIHYLISQKNSQERLSNEELKKFLKSIEAKDLYLYEENHGVFEPKLYVNTPLSFDVFEQIFDSVSQNGSSNVIKYVKKGNQQGLYLYHLQEHFDKVGRSLLIVQIDPSEFLDENFYFSDWQNTSASIVAGNEIIASTREGITHEKIYLHTEEVLSENGVHFIESNKFIGAYKVFFEGETFFSIIKPITGTPLSLVIDSSSYTVEKGWIKFMTYSIAFLAMLLIFSLGVVFVFSKRFHRPINKLLYAMKAVGSGDLKARYQQTAFGFEINTLGYHFNQMCESLKKLLEDIKNITVKKEVLENELKIGQQVQRTLQHDFTFRAELLNIKTYFEPARHVGGDFFDILEVEKNGKKYLLIAIADTCGKGIFACLYSLILKALLKAALTTAKTFEEAIITANALFYNDTKLQDAFVTAIFCWIDLESYELFYTSCGHLPLLVVNDNSIQELNTEGIALGVFADIELEVKKIQMQKDQVFVLHSDGINEMVNEQDDPLGMERLKSVLLESGLDIHVMEKNLVEKILTWRQSVPIFDDETFILFKRPNFGGF